MNIKNYVFFLAVPLIAASCEKKTGTIAPEAIVAESKKANVFFDSTFDAAVDRSPMYQTYLGIKKDYGKLDDISAEHEEKEMEITKKELEKLKKEINFELLDEQTQLSYRLFEYNTKMQIEGFQYRFHNYPVNQMFGWHSEFPSFMINIHQVTDSSDAVAYVSRLNAVGPLIDQLIKNLQLRAEKGIIAPKFVFPMVIDDCKNLLTGKPYDASATTSSVLFEDFTRKINALSLKEATKTSLTKNAETALITSVKPAYQKLITYLTELEKKADKKDGVWKFPDGDKFYKFALKNTTTTNLEPEQIFQTGLSEVARIHGEMHKIMKKVNFKSDSLKEFFFFMKNDKQFFYPNDSAGKKQYLAKSVAIIDTMRANLDKIFITKPKANMIVKAVEPFREKSAGTAFYQDPAPDGSRPGIYYVNLYNMSTASKYEMEALAYHEGIPGHHMQLAIAQELSGLPKFRKYNSSYTSYVEGWGLYSELVPKEIGFYQDPYSDFGRLSMELWRACRLVVDVGLHHKQWTREQAIKYLQDNTSAADRECIKSIERYIVMPSQATAYKVGMLKILELRENAKKQLGDKFDIREYHDVVLKYGAVPLEVLAENVQKWVDSKK